MQCCDCRTELDDALILVCDHNLCLECAAKRGIPTGSIRCRICGSTTALEPASVQQLRVMYPQVPPVTSMPGSQSSSPAPILQRPPLPYIPVHAQSPVLQSRSVPLHLPIHTISQSQSMSTTCGQCERACADLRCVQCDELLCSECCSALHKRGRMASHQTLPLSFAAGQSCTPRSSSSPMSMSRTQDRSVITMRSVSCAAHIDEIVQYFCLKCETRPMCSECVFRSGEHTNHLQDVVLIKKAFPKIRGRINDLVFEFEKSMKDVKMNEVSLCENKKSLENLNFNCKSQLGRFFDELRESLRLREIELVGKVDQIIEKEVKQIDKEIDATEEKRSRIESVFELLNSVRDIQPGSTSGSSFEKEIDILEAFSEMKATVSESRAELMRNDIKLVQLFVGTEQISRMQQQIDEIKHHIAGIEGVVPANSNSSRTFEFREKENRSSASSVAGSSGKRKSRKNSHAESGPTKSDMFLMTAIDDVMRAS